MMNLKLYRYGGTPNRIDKTNYLELKKELSGVTIKQTDSVINVFFELRYDKEIWSCNYLYCQELGRYYFIDDIVMTTGDRLTLQCTTDVLMTAKDSILTSPAWVQSAGADTDAEQKFLQNEFPKLQNDTLVSWEFPNDHFLKNIGTNTNIVLVTI